LGFGLVVATAWVAYWFAGTPSGPKQLVLAASLFLALGFVVWRGWLPLVGPVLLYDLVRTTRRNRFTLYRVYTYFVLVVMAGYYAVWQLGTRDTGALSTRNSALFAQGFFYGFLSLQILLVALLTPAYLGGVIADEKESRTLEYLLATDLRNREIILGKLGARLANLLLMLLTGLPIMSFIELMGGVEPLLVLAGFGVALLTAASVSCVSILNSVYARKPRGAILVTYLALAIYIILSTASRFLAGSWVSGISLSVGSYILTGSDVAYAFSVGNPIVQLFEALRAIGAGGNVASSVASRVCDYAIFHCLVGVVCVTWASLRLRAVFLRQAEGDRPRTRRLSQWAFRPRVGRRPMLWKEMFVEGGLRLGWIGKLLLAALVAASFLSYSLAFSYATRGAGSLAPYFASYLSSLTGCAVACLLLLAVAVRSANSLSGERNRQTLDGLLTTPLKTSEILLAKWLGSVLTVRLGFVWLGVIWGIGVAAGVWHWLVLPLWALAWFVYAAFLAILGLWFSLTSRTSLRAMLCILVCFLLMIIIPFVPFYALVFNINNAWYPAAERWYDYQTALSPLKTLGFLLPFPRAGAAQPISRGSTSAPWVKEPWEHRAAFLSLALWGVATALIWWRTSVRFGKLTGRRPGRIRSLRHEHAASKGR